MKIVTYHYVRDKSVNYPYLNVLTKKNFIDQIKFINKKYDILTPEEANYKIKNKIRFKPNQTWLTFDDGYKEHYKFVLPLLQRLKIKASFYPSNLSDRLVKVMNVNKVQFILSKFKNKKKLFDEIKNIYMENFELENFNKLFSKNISRFNKFDNPLTKQIKFIFSIGLPSKINNKILNILFKKYITNDEKDFAEKLYMNLKELKEMKRLGNEIGGHGKKHLKLEFLSYKEQMKEIFYSKNFLLKNKLINKNNWSYCYPHGSYNLISIEILKKLKVTCALTIEEGNVNIEEPLRLPRIDTNKLIKR